MRKLGFIGTGTMAGVMLEAALRAGFLRAEDVLVYDKNPAASERFGVTVAESALEVAAQCEIIQLGVKPQDQPALLEGISAEINDKLIVSIAAGIGLAQIQHAAPRCVRLMPNINAAVGQGMTAWCASEEVAAEEREFVRQYCECFGQVICLEERHFSAFLALAGSGPAFVYLFIDELARAGVAAGLPRSTALEIAAQSVLGSAAMVQGSDLHPCELADRVCSPGGTTIAGVNALREHGFAHAVSQAVLAAAARDREMGMLDIRR